LNTVISSFFFLLNIVTPRNYPAVGIQMPVVYGQQQSPPVTSLGSAFQLGVPPASKGSDKVLMSVKFSMNIL
jgi:hypothetical protein